MKRAFLVGINRYRNPRNNLFGCINDMLEFFKTIIDVYGFPKNNCKTLTDYIATQTNILNGFTSLLKETQPGDTAIFYFSGHGTQVIDTSGDEIVDGLDECLCPHDLSWLNPLTDDLLHNIIENNLSDGAKLWMVFDCCHSGTLSRNIDQLCYDDYSDYDDCENTMPTHHHLDGYEKARFINPTVDVLLRSVDQNDCIRSFKKGIETSKEHAVLSAAQSYQKALEMRINGKPRGIFTTTLTECIKENPKMDGVLLKQMLYNNIKKYTRDQNPHIEVPSNFTNIFQ